METIKLNELLTMLHIICEDERVIQGISDNSKEVESDWLFVSRHCDQAEAKSHMQEALAKGAVVLCDQEMSGEHIYHCSCVEHILQALLELYYGDMCEQLCVIGITGTNGKTSVATIITQILRKQGNEVMQIGTGSVNYNGIEQSIHNTTPGCFQLANYFKEAKRLSIPTIVMEVSSHAIDQNRINFIHYDMIVYTNITQDHLDYHLTKTHYRYTKFKLRRYLKQNGCIIYNGDLPYMQELINMAHHTCVSVGCGEVHFPIREVQMDALGITFKIHDVTFHSSLLSMVNIYNITEALVVCRRLKIPYNALQEAVEQLRPIPGRLEVVYGKGFTIWLDYAHTPDAIQTLLTFAQSITQGRVISIVGCGGDRDRKKRVIMGDSAANHSDIAIFTSDNPRSEAVDNIIHDMIDHPRSNVEVIENRYFAIKHAIKIAQNNDIIIIAGKGNEQVQIIQGVAYPFSDREIALQLVKEELSWK